MRELPRTFPTIPEAPCPGQAEQAHETWEELQAGISGEYPLAALACAEAEAAGYQPADVVALGRTFSFPHLGIQASEQLIMRDHRIFVRRGAA